MSSEAENFNVQVLYQLHANVPMTQFEDELSRLLYSSLCWCRNSFSQWLIEYPNVHITDGRKRYFYLDFFLLYLFIAEEKVR